MQVPIGLRVVKAGAQHRGVQLFPVRPQQLLRLTEDVMQSGVFQVAEVHLSSQAECDQQMCVGRWANDQRFNRKRRVRRISAHQRPEHLCVGSNMLEIDLQSDSGRCVLIRRHR